MIEYNHRQVLTIILKHAKVVFWYTQLIIRVFGRVETILYSDQHVIALLRASLSRFQHTFSCICQSVLIIYSATDFLFKCIQLRLPLYFFFSKIFYLHLFLLLLDFLGFFFEISFCWHCSAVLIAKGHCSTSDRGDGFSRETWKTGWT